jgi:hypothetical protein
MYGWHDGGVPVLGSQRVSTTTTAVDDQETPPSRLRRAPDKMIMHNSVGIMPGGYVGLRFGWDLPG